jgi:hypothetical protein
MYQLLMETPFTADEKRECLPTIELLLELTHIARNEGLLAMQEAAKQHAELFLLRKGISLATDGAEPAVVKEILQNYIASSAYHGAELLRAMLITESVLGIYAGEHPRIMTEKLHSLLGADFYEEACMYLRIRPFNEGTDTMQKYFADMETETYPEGTNLLEEVFLAATGTEIQQVLRQVDMDVCAKALVGSSKKIQKLFCDNLAESVAVVMVNTCMSDEKPTTEEIIKAQHKILAVYYSVKAV